MLFLFFCLMEALGMAPLLELEVFLQELFQLSF